MLLIQVLSHIFKEDIFSLLIIIVLLKEGDTLSVTFP